MFHLPSFSNSGSACLVVSLGVIDEGGNPMNNLIVSFEERTVKPVDPSLEIDYNFKVRAIYNYGGEAITTTKSLRIGCTSSMIITQDNSFTTKKTLVIGSSPIGIILSKPSSNRAYCPFVKNTIIENSIFVN